MEPPILQCVDLYASYSTKLGRIRAVDGISFEIRQGENLGLVGESGCGKSTVIKSIIKVFPRNFRIDSGKIIFKGQDMVPLDYDQMRQYRWKEISVIPQSAMNALNPVYKVGYQIQEAILEHQSIGPAAAKERVKELFSMVGIDPYRMEAFPHQFSGGMKQRANIAMALALNPSLIIADEPTTALDVLVQDQIFQRIINLQKDLNCSIMLVTHDISLVAENCDRVCVMYAGKIMESGTVERVLTEPHHPYTMGLKNAFPSITRSKELPLISIPGSPPALIDPPDQCRFCNRCPFSTDICWKVIPPNIEVEKNHFALCHHLDKVVMMREQAAKTETWEDTAIAGRSAAGGF
jgi:oligopeptide/dipeptide ABC transporter ATP-binding protein